MKKNKILPHYFTTHIVDVHPYKMFRYGATKTVKFVQVLPLMITETLLSRAIF